MKHKQVLWVLLCFLTIQVSSCLFGKCCDNKIATKEKIVVKTNKYHEQKELVLKIDQDALISNTVAQDKIIVLGNEEKIKKTKHVIGAN